MNPVLLKPGSDLRSHVVVMGRPAGTLEAGEFAGGRAALARAAYDAFDDLARPLRRRGLRGRRLPRRDQPARPRLRQPGARPARRRSRRCWSATSTAAGCSPRCTAPSRCSTRPTRRSSAGCVVNRFRGDVGLLRPGLAQIGAADRTAGARRGAVAAGPVAGLRGLAVGAGPARPRRTPAGARCGWRWCGCRGSATSPTWTRSASSRASRSTSSTTRAPYARPTSWCSPAPARRSPTSAGCASAGWPTPYATTRRAAARCSGSAAASRCWVGRSPTRTGSRGRPGAGSPGLGLLDATTTFGHEKVLGTPSGTALGAPVTGYEIHHGRVRVGDGEELPGRRPLGRRARHDVARLPGGRRVPGAPGCRRPPAAAGRDGPPASARSRSPRPARRGIDAIADALEEHLDLDAVLRLVEQGATPGLAPVRGGLVP